MNCTLIRPAYRTSGYDEGTQECLGLGYVGGVLRRSGHRVTVVDAELEQLGEPETIARAAESDPRLVGLSVMSEDAFDSVMRLVPALREVAPGAHLTIGGNLPSFDPEWIFRICPDIDSVVRFEGERPIVALAERLESELEWRDLPGLCSLGTGGMRCNPAAPAIDDLDGLPFPIRDTLPIALRGGMMPPVSSSRGCHAKCTFCAVHRFNLDPARPWRFRSPANVVDEIDRLVSDYAVAQINFVDDDFIGNARVGQPRARAIAAELMRRRLRVGFSVQCRAEWIDRDTFRPLKDAGLQMVFFGIEAVDGSTQQRFRKAQTSQLVLRTLRLLEELDIYTHVGFIMFTPWTTLEDIQASLDFLHEIGHLNIHTATNFLQLSPGTPILAPLMDDGIAYREPHGGYAYRFADPRVAAVKAIFDRALWPLFPHWYESLMARWSVLSRAIERQRAPRADFLGRYDDAVYGVARLIVQEIAKDPATDLFALSQAANVECRRLLADVPEPVATPYARRLPALCGG